MMTRRDCLAAVAATAVRLKGAPSGNTARSIGLGLGNYGLKTLSTRDAINLIAKIGYDSIELTMMPGWTTEPVKVSAAERREIQKQIGGLGMALPSLLEQIPILGEESEHKAHLERIRHDAQFGYDVNPGVNGVVPCVQTHIGGSYKDWDRLKNIVAARLHDWAETGREMHTVVAVKGHNLNLNDTSAKTLWLMQQVNSPWLRVLYDYSHYQAMGEDLDRTLDLLLPYTAMISIKDGKNYGDKPGYERLLPGDGHIDYIRYYRHLMRFAYHGSTVVEISGQISARPGYDPIATANKCYAYVAQEMTKAGVPRPQHTKIS